ncbi:MAG TPA: RsmD family RNA methyltransferase [Phycisphaerae bacterium]|nr:RsmD family RNA methyltransferase [Phycisphaerae bacterium]
MPTLPLISTNIPTMRVIAGKYRGRTLATPEGASTRPILDRVKGSLFDWLGSRLALPGYLPAVNVCDLFCGAGSQGIESLSRGAAFCAFVEIDPAALKCLRENLATLRVAEPHEIVARSAEAATVRPPDGRGFSIIFIDPPFRLSQDLRPESTMGRVIARLGNQIPTELDALLLWRHDEALRLPDKLAETWQTTDRRAWGTNAISLYEQGP